MLFVRGGPLIKREQELNVAYQGMFLSVAKRPKLLMHFGTVSLAMHITRMQIY